MLVTVGEVLLMEAASGVMLVMGGWGRVELGWGAVLGAPAAAMSLRPCMRDAGTLILPSASLCSANQQAVCLEHWASKPTTSGNLAMASTTASSVVEKYDVTSTLLLAFGATQHFLSDSLQLCEQKLNAG